MSTRQPRPVFVVIPCGGEKLDTPARARDLYTSSMFRLALAAAENSVPEGTEATVLVLSAQHGLITLDTWIAPYDVKMGDPGSVTADEVAEQAQALGITYGADVYSLCPSRYFTVLDEALRHDDVYAADVYEADAGIGYQRHTCTVVRDN